MKKLSAVILALLLCFLVGKASLAEAPAHTSEPAAEETIPAEPIQEERAQSSPFLTWLGQGLNLLSDFVESSTHTVSDTVSSWAHTAGDTLHGWYSTVEAFVVENADAASAAVEQAWETVKQATAEGASVAKDTLDEALETLQTWLDSLQGDTTEAQEALDGIVEQLTPEDSAR